MNLAAVAPQYFNRYLIPVVSDALGSTSVPRVHSLPDGNTNTDFLPLALAVGVATLMNPCCLSQPIKEVFGYDSVRLNYLVDHIIGLVVSSMGDAPAKPEESQRKADADFDAFFASISSMPASPELSREALARKQFTDYLAAVRGHSIEVPPPSPSEVADLNPQPWLNAHANKFPMLV